MPHTMKFAVLVLAASLALAACADKPNEATHTDAPIKTAIETRAPGDFTLESIVKGAERHMGNAGYTEIPADELKELYPNIAALPVEVRGRRAADGTEYLVIASSDGRDIKLIPDVNEVLEKDAAQRAETLQMEYGTAAGGVNKYGAVAVSKSDANSLISILIRTFTGEYIFN